MAGLSRKLGAAERNIPPLCVINRDEMKTLPVPTRRYSELLDLLFNVLLLQ